MSESCATGNDPVIFSHGVLTCSGSRFFRQLQEISDSVKEVEWGDVDVGLALERSRVAQAELERTINTRRARQRYVCPIPPPSAREAAANESIAYSYIRRTKRSRRRRSGMLYFVSM